MDSGTLRGLFTLVLTILFIALVVWAYSGKRKRTFDAAARLPLEDGGSEVTELARREGR